MSLTKVSYSMIQGAPANVLDYGADPTGTSDSAAAIRAAAKTGRKLYFPAGTYRVDSSINYNDFVNNDSLLLNDVYWFGDGTCRIGEPTTGATVIQYNGTGTFLEIGQTTPTYYGPSVMLKDMVIKGNGVTGHTTTVYGGYTTSTKNDSGSSSSQVGASFVGNSIPKSIIENVYFYGLGTGILFKGLCYGFTVKSCVVANTNIGMEMRDTITSILVSSTEFASCSLGIWISGTGNQNIHILDGVFEAITSGAGVLVTGDATALTIARHYWTANQDNFYQVGYNPSTAPSNGGLYSMWFYENFGASLYFGDSVGDINVHDNLLDSSASYSFGNSYAYQPATLKRRIQESNNFDAANLSPYQKFNGTKAAEIIHYSPGTQARVSSGYGEPLIPNAADTLVVFDEASWDDNTEFSPTLHTITVDRNGKYLIVATATFEANSTGIRNVKVVKNGSTTIGYFNTPAAASGATYISYSFIANLSASDSLEMYVYQNSGGNLKITQAAGAYPALTAQLL